ncbi:MAG TPA: inorganic diphosphatase [Candidatus Dormibacteraeota bacterium]|nr:inorganic diphosphatase [Candidatus Dormibacteraeota bacterium]
MEIDVVVEVPKGSRNKYEMDHESGVIRLDRDLSTAVRYPTDYGFIDGTMSEDGDPLDALVVLEEPTFPGCHITCRPIGLFIMRDEKGPDLKVLAVPTWDERHDVSQMPSFLLTGLRHFFDVYKDVEPEKFTEVGEWSGREAAEEEIQRCRERHAADHRF